MIIYNQSMNNRESFPFSYYQKGENFCPFRRTLGIQEKLTATRL